MTGQLQENWPHYTIYACCATDPPFQVKVKVSSLIHYFTGAGLSVRMLDTCFLSLGHNCCQPVSLLTVKGKQRHGY